MLSSFTHLRFPLLCLGLVLPVGVSHAELRSFIDVSGRTLRGELISTAGDTVVIKREDGQVFTLKASEFCPADVAYFKEHGMKPAASGAASVPDKAALIASYQARVKAVAQQPYEEALADLNSKYEAALEQEQKGSQQRGDLEIALALKNEHDRVGKGKPVPEWDNDKDPSVLKKLRATYRQSQAKLASQRAAKLPPLRAAFARELDSAVPALTKAGRLDDAAELQKRADILRAQSTSGGPLRIVGFWHITQSNKIDAKWTFNGDMTYNYWNETGKFSFNQGKYILKHTWDWEVTMSDDDTFDGVCIRGEKGVKIHGTRVE